MTRFPPPKADDRVMRVGNAWVSLSSTVAFLPIEKRGKAHLFVKVHPAVVLIDCGCGAKPGEPCIGANGPRVVCHADRKTALYAHQKRAAR